MKRIWLAIFLAVLVIGPIASLLGWLEYKDRWVAPAPKPPNIPSVTPAKSASVAVVVEAVQRPILWSSRRPILKEDKKDGVERDLSQSTLSAVFQSGSTKIAVLKKPDGVVMKLSNSSHPWRLDAFDGRRAVFVSEGGKSVERFLEFKGAPPSPAAVGSRVGAPSPSFAASGVSGTQTPSVPAVSAAGASSGKALPAYMGGGAISLPQLPGLGSLFPQQTLKAPNAQKK